ncbi:MAG: hypothetical protein U5R06_21465 [candidate division KSB1 bacterium]|nr:hypothetical protein [candidate division KSB1 bacterium]
MKISFQTQFTAIRVQYCRKFEKPLNTKEILFFISGISYFFKVVMIKVPKNINPEFIVDQQGKKRAVILSIEEYEQPVEDIHDLTALAERREEEPIPHSRVIEELKRDGCFAD